MARRIDQTLARASRREALRAQTEVLAREGSSDAEFNPFLVGDAAVVLDLLLDVDEDGESYFERYATTIADAVVAQPDAHERFRRMSATLRTLRAHAVAIHRAESPRLFAKTPQKWLAIGVRTARDEYRTQYPGSGSRAVRSHDTHYHCVICDENLATLGSGTVRTLSREFMRPIERHVDVCAMRFLLEIHKPAQLAETKE